MINSIQLFNSLEYGLIFSVVAVGVYLSFRTLNFPDLSVDGTFPLGGAVCAALILAGADPVWAILAATGAGAAAGWVTAWLSTSLGILNLQAGIITMTALYSINMRVMGGRPNLSLYGEVNLFDKWFIGLKPLLPMTWHLVPLSLIVLSVGGGILYLLKTDWGLGLRATGSNARMGRAYGVNDAKMVQAGLAMSNGLIALGGALFTQMQTFADISMGLGTLITGLVAVIFGEAVFHHRKRMIYALLGCVVGSVFYRMFIAAALNVGDLGLQATDMNLITAILVVLAMTYPNLRKKMKGRTS